MPSCVEHRPVVLVLSSTEAERVHPGHAGQSEGGAAVMTICYTIITPVIILLRTLVQVIREFVRRVCEWVSRVIEIVRRVVERVCRWLPWPLSELCKLVTRLIRVFETVWRWVCHNVLERVVSWVEVIVEYVIYIARWVCWVIGLPPRVIGVLACMLGISEGRRYIHVCVRVLTDAEGVPAAEWEKINTDIKNATLLLQQCDIELVVTDRQRLEKPEFLTGTTCDATGIFTDFFVWFSRNECVGCSSITAYYVQDIHEKAGCAYPRSNWFTIDAGGDGSTFAHEIGHLCDLLHTDDPTNIMNSNGGSGSQIAPWQCCMYRTSHFALSAACGRPEVEDIELGASAMRTTPAHGGGGHAFETLNRKGPASVPMMPSRVLQATAALIGSVWVGVWLARKTRGRASRTRH